MTAAKDINVSKEEVELDEAIRPLGFSVCALLAVSSLAMAKSIIENSSKWGEAGFSWVIMISDAGCLLMASYFVICCALPEYLLGKPEKWRVAPLAIGGVLTFLAGILAFVYPPPGIKRDIYFWIEFLCPIPFMALASFAHLLNDEEESAWLMLKPWRKSGANAASSV